MKAVTGETTHPQEQWLVVDVTDLPFGDASFGGIVDKGTIDAVQFTGDAAAAEMLAEADRVLAADGVILSVSGEEPEDRLDLLRTCLPGYTHSYQLLDEVWNYYFYISRRCAKNQLHTT